MTTSVIDPVPQDAVLPLRAAGAGDRPTAWLKRLAPFREPDPRRSVAEIAVSALPLAALWLAMWLSLDLSYALTLLLAVPAAGFLVRLFMIQHDCGHGSLFRQRRINDWVGRVIGVLTLTPYDHWRHSHAVHHATAGNLDQRGIGDVDTLTVAEYRRLPRWRRALYRLCRNPFTVLIVGPVYLFVFQYRLPTQPLRAGWAAWRSAMGTNLAIAALVGAMVAIVGWRDFFLVQAPITWLAASCGVWLFYVQHQFEHTYWERDASWSVHEGAMAGSSHLDLPPVLRWFTANIGVHHVHHLCSRIPSYRLGEVLRAHPELRGINRITLRRSLECFRLALWDEEARRLVSFSAARRLPA